MHEMAITQSLVELAIEAANHQPVRRVVVEIGQLSGIWPEAIQFCFGPCTEGTPLAGAELAIDLSPGRATCRACGAAIELHDPLDLCSVCGSPDLAIDHGRDLILKSLEIVLCA